MRGNPNIQARGGLKVHLADLGHSYDELDTIMQDNAIVAKVAHIARHFNVTRITALKWVYNYQKEHKSEDENSAADDSNQEAA